MAIFGASTLVVLVVALTAIIIVLIAAISKRGLEIGPGRIVLWPPLEGKAETPRIRKAERLKDWSPTDGEKGASDRDSGA